MDRDDRNHQRNLISEVATWTHQAQAVLDQRRHIVESGERAARTLRDAQVRLDQDGLERWRVLTLSPTERDLLTALSAATGLGPLMPNEATTIDQLVGPTADAVRRAKAINGPTRFFRGTEARDKGTRATAYLNDFHGWAVDNRLGERLGQRLGADGQSEVIECAEALSDRAGLRQQLAPSGEAASLTPAGGMRELQVAIPAIDAALRDDSAIVDSVRSAAAAVRDAEVQAMLRDMPIERLRDATGQRLRLGALGDAGFRTVHQVLHTTRPLTTLPGVGDVTAARMLGAARALWRAAHDDMPVRLDITKRTAQATTLLARLAAWSATASLRRSPGDLALLATLRPLAARITHATNYLIIVEVDGTASEFITGVDRLLKHGQAMSDARPPGVDPWDDFMNRPADYYSMLSELGFLTEDEQKSHGDLPDDIVEAIRATELDTQHLNASLRGYQGFGARFALSQRKVIIGDEMGLGKTVEALAVLAHLRAKGGLHTVVVCPAAVVTNWVREVGSKSRLPAHRVHGPGRDAALSGWVRRGGVAVTTFETLGWLEPRLPRGVEIACVVVDEAHYIKNPFAKRSERTLRLISGSSRAVLLTGTPLENKLEEFRALVRYVRPDLVVDGSGLSARKFRQQVAPAYLRRNQEDVLTELPELVEVDEWLPMSASDAADYREAVGAGNFARMRQAALVSGTDSEKLKRLVEIVTEAEENGRRVIVFSHFLAVLEAAAAALPGRVFGPLTGAVPAVARQRMVDEFSASRRGSVLVAQIIAGGVGLNIQAASVVVICEPQLKPTTEWQAIARAHRMGQLDTVQVHRLLSEEGVDVRVTEILARKQELFAEFARVSETADSAPEAMDISEAELSREVIAAERERLFVTSPTTTPAHPLGSG